MAADLAADRDENSAKWWLGVGVETSSALRAEERGVRCVVSKILPGLSPRTVPDQDDRQGVWVVLQMDDGDGSCISMVRSFKTCVARQRSREEGAVKLAGRNEGITPVDYARRGRCKGQSRDTRRPDSAADTGAADRVTSVRARPPYFLAACFGCRGRRTQEGCTHHQDQTRIGTTVLHHL
jgi:hypothetical protein